MSDKGPGAWLTNLGMVFLLTAPKILPYTWRIPFYGWLSARVLTPLTGHEGRSRANLKLVRPDLSNTEITAICRASANNAGRMVGEMYSQKGLFNRIQNLEMRGPGVDALETARLARRPIIAVSGHFGNYDVVRAVFSRAGHQVGGLYRPMKNVFFNRHYTRHLEAVAAPSFPVGRRGLGGMIRHLRAGNMIALLTDQRDFDGAKLSFFGHPVMTPLSAAELALKYDAVVIPVYAIRQENGLDFVVEVEAPVPHTDAESMMQAINDSLEARVRTHMGQYLWAHRRWLLPVSPAKDNAP